MPLREDEIGEVTAIVKAEIDKAIAALAVKPAKVKAPAKVAKKEPAKDVERPFR